MNQYVSYAPFIPLAIVLLVRIFRRGTSHGLTYTTLTLLTLAGGIFGYLKLVDSKLPTSDDARIKKGAFVDAESVDRKYVTGVTIRNSEGTIELTGNDQQWRLASPVKDSVDVVMLTNLFTTLEGLTGREVKGLKNVRDSHKEFGVQKGEMSVKLQGTKPVEILLGKDHATAGKIYARVEGKDPIYVIEKKLRDDLSKTVKDWRSKRLMDIGPGEVAKISLHTAKGEVELVRQGPNWSFTKPFKARGDNQKINDLLSNVTTAQVDDFLTESKDAGAFGLTEPRATLTLLAVGQPTPVVLQLGAPVPAKPEDKDEKAAAEAAAEPKKKKAPPKTFLYAKLSTREGILTAPTALEKLINLQPNDLRDRSLIRVQADIVDRITIESAKGKVVLGRKAEDWVRKIEGKPDERVNNIGANKLLSELIQAKITRTVADMTSDLKPFGLDHPQVTVTLSSYSTEGTPEEAPGDRPIAKLLLGQFEGDAGYAKLDDEPFIVAVPATLLEELWTDPIQWQELRLNNLEKEDIVEVEITRRSFPPGTYVLDKTKGWISAKGDAAVNQISAQSLVNAIADLRAVRWEGPTDAVKQGMDKPELVVRYTLANKKTGKITVGNLSEDGMWNAMVDGKPGTFLMPMPDLMTLGASLLETPKPAGTIVPEGTPGNPGKTPPVPAPGTPGAPAVGPAAPAGEMPPAVPPPDTPGKTPEPPKPTEATPGTTKPAPESMPKGP